MSRNPLLDPTLQEILQVIKPTQEDRDTRIRVIDQLRDVLPSVECLRGATVQAFGSFESNLFTRWGDLDISIDLFSGSSILFTEKEETQKFLGHLLLAMKASGLWHELQFVKYARVPILKVVSHPQGISCDISIDNLYGLLKSRFMFWISGIDGRFRDLLLLVKEWAKAYNINDSKNGTFNSYSLTLLVIFHFQTCVPAILPPLREIYPKSAVEDLKGVRKTAEESIAQVAAANIAQFKSGMRNSVNRSSLSELLVSFFAKFSDIHIKAQKLGVCPFTGRWEDISNNTTWQPKTYSLFVEDPFEQPQNAARSVRRKNLNRIAQIFEMTWRRLASDCNRNSIIGVLKGNHIQQPRDVSPQTTGKQATVSGKEEGEISVSDVERVVSKDTQHPELTVESNRNKLQDLNQQIALLESEQKLKAAQPKKDAVNPKISPAGRVSIISDDTRQLEPNEPATKRLKVSENDTSQPVLGYRMPASAVLPMNVPDIHKSLPPAVNANASCKYIRSNNDEIAPPVISQPTVEMEHAYRDQLQAYALKQNLELPVYVVELEGPPHALRFRCKVIFCGQTFQSQEYFKTLKSAKHATKLALVTSLGPEGIELAYNYKNLLQEIAQKENSMLPVYATATSGPSHAPTFTSTVEFAGKVFSGEEAKTKKMAEMSAAKVAFMSIKNGNSLPSLSCERQKSASSNVKRNLQESYSQPSKVVTPDVPSKWIEVYENELPDLHNTPARNAEESYITLHVPENPINDGSLNAPTTNAMTTMNIAASSLPMPQNDTNVVTLDAPPHTSDVKMNIAASSLPVPQIDTNVVLLPLDAPPANAMTMDIAASSSPVPQNDTNVVTLDVPLATSAINMNIAASSSPMPQIDTNVGTLDAPPATSDMKMNIAASSSPMLQNSTNNGNETSSFVEETDKKQLVMGAGFGSIPTGQHIIFRPWNPMMTLPRDTEMLFREERFIAYRLMNP